jgi:hypothetical protein
LIGRPAFEMNGMKAKMRVELTMLRTGVVSTVMSYLSLSI